jgi:hypothetical protein
MPAPLINCDRLHWIFAAWFDSLPRLVGIAVAVDNRHVKGVTPMDVATLARHAIEGMSKDVYENRPGLANALKLMSRVAPQFIFRQLSKSANNMLAEMKSEA